MTEQPYPALDASAYLVTRTTLDALSQRLEQRTAESSIWAEATAALLAALAQLDIWAREQGLISDGQLASMVEVSLQRLLDLPPADERSTGVRPRGFCFWRRSP